MSVSIYKASTGKVTPLAGIPKEILDSKADSSALYSPDDTESALIAEKSHTEGDYFEVNGNFVKALDDIAIGDTLEEGINIESTNIGSELERIDSGLAGKASASDVNTIQAVIPSNADPTSNKLATMADVSGGGSGGLTLEKITFTRSSNTLTLSKALSGYEYVFIDATTSYSNRTVKCTAIIPIHKTAYSSGYSVGAKTSDYTGNSVFEYVLTFHVNSDTEIILLSGGRLTYSTSNVSGGTISPANVTVDKIYGLK